MKDAWVLRLKDESKEEDMEGEYYYCEHTGAPDVTSILEDAKLFSDKEETIKQMKVHEKRTFNTFGEDAVCDGGYTNMMKNFEFVEVELVDVD